jgi:hypothetical protein
MEPNTPVLFSVMVGSAWLLGVVLFLLIAWAIIRGAVLSALRKHHQETQRAAPRAATATQAIQTHPGPAPYRHDA